MSSCQFCLVVLQVQLNLSPPIVRLTVELHSQLHFCIDQEVYMPRRSRKCASFLTESQEYHHGARADIAGYQKANSE